jgi:hypothetical protein
MLGTGSGGVSSLFFSCGSKAVAPVGLGFGVRAVGLCAGEGDGEIEVAVGSARSEVGAGLGESVAFTSSTARPADCTATGLDVAEGREIG